MINIYKNATTEQVVKNIGDDIILHSFNYMKSVSDIEAKLFLQLMAVRICAIVIDELGNDEFVRIWNLIDDSFNEVLTLEDIQSGKRKSDA